jgi:hypothetical protein
VHHRHSTSAFFCDNYASARIQHREGDRQLLGATCAHGHENSRVNGRGLGAGIVDAQAHERGATMRPDPPRGVRVNAGDGYRRKPARLSAARGSCGKKHLGGHNESECPDLHALSMTTRDVGRFRRRIRPGCG